MSVEMTYDHPVTRGELCEKLRVGIQCEVMEYVAEMTATMLRGWLNFKDFTVCLSENEGWVIFKPNIVQPTGVQ